MSSVSIPDKKVYTAEDIERLTSEGYRYELVEGELLPMPPTSGGHGRTTARLHTLIDNHVIQSDLGVCYSAETGFRLTRNPDTVLAPDFAFVRMARAAGLSDEGFVELAPDMVVETRSPTSSNREIEQKLRRWLSFGVLLVLDLDPARHAITVYRPGFEPVALGKGDTLTGYDVLLGFSFAVAEIFK